MSPADAAAGPPFSIDFRSEGRAATIVYREAGRTLEVYLDLSGVPQYDFVGGETAFARWTDPAGIDIPEPERARIRERIDLWARKRRIRLHFSPPMDVKTYVQEMAATHGLAVSEGVDAEGRQTFRLERPPGAARPPAGERRGDDGVWDRLRRWLGL